MSSTHYTPAFHWLNTPIGGFRIMRFLINSSVVIAFAFVLSVTLYA